MIVGKRKPLDEILGNSREYNSIIIVGCGECVTVCHAGGEKEVQLLASQLKMSAQMESRALSIKTAMVERQCDLEFIEKLTEEMAGVDAILTLGCGAGAQSMASVFPDLPLVPCINTRFIGAQTSSVQWDERCSGCGNCIVGEFGGFCPITRCSKNLLNGPCGGSQDGHCELDPEIECVWQLIIDKLMAKGQLDKLMKLQKPKNWQTSKAGGPRQQQREDSNQ